MMRGLLVVSAFVAFMAWANISLAQKVELKLLVLKAKNDSILSEPVTRQPVYLLLHTGSPLLKETDGQGKVSFLFDPTAYMDVIVGEPGGDSIRLHRMSAKTNTNTSVILAANMVKGAGQYDDILDFAIQMKEARGNGKLPLNIKSNIESLRTNLINTPFDANDEDKKDRLEAIKVLEEALQPLGKLGIQYETKNTGAVVQSVFRNSPADQSGIKPGDVISSVNGREITKNFDLPKAFATSPDQKVDLEVQRPGTGPFSISTFLQP